MNRPSLQWKVLERRVARDLDTFRTPLSGSASHLTAGDVVHPQLYVECKYRKRSALHTMMAPVCVNAHHEGKIPLLVVQQANSRQLLAVIEWPLFLRLLDGQEKEQGHDQP